MTQNQGFGAELPPASLISSHLAHSQLSAEVIPGLCLELGKGILVLTWVWLLGMLLGPAARFRSTVPGWTPAPAAASPGLQQPGVPGGRQEG